MTSYITRVRQWLGEMVTAARSDDRGAITTETAVVTFILVSLAIAIGALLLTYATGVVNSFPTP